jgi:hypothetical protein
VPRLQCPPQNLLTRLLTDLLVSLLRNQVIHQLFHRLKGHPSYPRKVQRNFQQQICPRLSLHLCHHQHQQGYLPQLLQSQQNIQHMRRLIHPQLTQPDFANVFGSRQKLITFLIYLQWLKCEMDDFSGKMVTRIGPSSGWKMGYLAKCG